MPDPHHRFHVVRVAHTRGLGALHGVVQAVARRIPQGAPVDAPVLGKRWGRPGHRDARLVECITGPGPGGRFFVDLHTARWCLRPLLLEGTPDILTPAQVQADLEALEAAQAAQ